MRVLRATLGAWPSLLAGAVVLGPVVLTDRTFGFDWPLHLWLVEIQRRSIEDTGLPTLFGHFTPVGTFYPVGAFLGGTFYAMGGYVAAATGSAEVGLIALHAVGVAATLVGWHAVCRSVGILGLAAHAPGVAHCTGAYYVGDLLGRGGVSNAVASATLPLLVGAVARSLTLEGRERWPWLLTAGVAATVVAGTHNVFLLWVLTLGVVLAPFALFACWGHLRSHPARWAQAAAVTVAGAMITGWQNVPNLAFGRETSQGRQVEFIAEWGGWFSRPSVWLHPLRVIPSEHALTSLYVQLPVLLMAWLVVVGGLVAVARRRGADPLMVWLAGLVTVLACAMVATASSSVFGVLPDLYQATQFGMRMNHFVLLSVSGLLVVVLALMRDWDPGRRRAAGQALAGILAFGLVLTGWQAWATTSVRQEPRAALVAGDDASRFWYDVDGFRDTALPLWTEPSVWLEIRPPLVADRLAVTVAGRDLRTGVSVPIQGAAGMLSITGARAVGRSKWRMILGDADAGESDRLVVVSSRAQGPVLVGALMSLAGLLLLAGIVVAVASGPGRRR